MATALDPTTGRLNIDTPRVFLPLLAQGPIYRGGRGGRSSGKSHFFAELLVEKCISQKGVRALCCREVQKSLKESAKKLIEDKIEALGVSGQFQILQTEIRTPGGGNIIFAGLKDYTADALKSMEQIDVAWLEEAETISEQSILKLEPTIIRNKGSELWASWNPKRRNAPIERMIPWHDKSVSVLVHANYRDNPFVDKTVYDLAARHKRDQPQSFSHVWLGDYEDAGAKGVIPYLWIDAAIGLAAKLGLEVTGKRIGGLDVAGAEEGGDENGFAVRHGIQIEHVEKWNGLDTSMTANRASKLAIEHYCSEVQYDSAGVGEGITGEWAAMGRRKEQPNGLQFIAWNGGNSVLEPEVRIDPGNPKSPKNKDHYQNLKAMAWFNLRRRFQGAYHASIGQPYDPDQIISISENIPKLLLTQLCDELSQPQQKLSGTGKVMVDKAPDSAKSPNLADPIAQIYTPLSSKSGIDYSVWG